MSPLSPGADPERVAAFFQKHRTGLVTLVFTDLVDSTALLQKLGDQAGATFLKRRREIIRDRLREVPEGEEIETAGDSFLIVFSKPSDAVRFSLLSQAQLRSFSMTSGLPVQERIGIHLGEVVIDEGETKGKAKDLYGIQLATASRVMSLAEGGQILVTRGVFDSARQVLKGEDITGVGQLSWVSHGPYMLKGVDEPVEVCEVAEDAERKPEAPKTSDKAQRRVPSGEEPVLGWRPAVGQEVSNTPWVLEEKLGEGGFGEVWRARHPRMKENRVFKFCFRADRVRTLKRELTLFRVLKEHIGDHPNIVRLHEVYLDEPPFFLEAEYVDGKDLKTWCEVHGGADTIPLETKLEIVAQAADALQAAHDAGIIHRDVKPGNILVSGDAVNQNSLRVKLTDFGIGQVVSSEVLAGVTGAGFTQTMLSGTSPQTGTHLYLAPELWVGKPASTRSDIYSLGVVLYQLVVSDFKRPLTTDWAGEVPDPLLLEDIGTCVIGKPEHRLGSAGLLAERLRARPQRSADSAARQLALRRRRVARAATILLFVAMVVTVGAYLWLRQTRIQWARNRALPEAEHLIEEARLAWDYSGYRQALDVVEKALPYLSHNPRLQEALDACSKVLSIDSEPPGAVVRVKPYDDQGGRWTVLGQTPVRGIRLGRGFFVVRFEKSGYAPVEAVCGTGDGSGDISRKLDLANILPSHMVRVPGRVVAGVGQLQDIFIDKYEVTNRRFKEFVDAGGYRNQRYWKEPFLRAGNAVGWEEAMSLFRDSTGQSGPATWISGDYPAEHADYPVSGVSWYEAAAYAQFAGKSLPTKDHWASAAGLDVSEYTRGFPTMVARFSNFRKDGPAPVGSHRGMNAFGATDMAGNVREWCWNKSPEGRFVRGGAWDDAEYMYLNESHHSAWDRSPRNGFRCVIYLDRQKIPPFVFESQGPKSRHDFRKDQPVSDSVFALFRAKFQYDPTELKAVVEKRDESSADWILEKVSFDAAYEKERVVLRLYLPRNSRKPYQSVIYFPGSNAQINRPASLGPDFAFCLDFLVKNGRAVAFPVYKGTYERRGDIAESELGPYTRAENLVKRVKDFRRCVDYLETRPDFDTQRIAFFGFSWGGTMGMIIPAVEPRLKANILFVGGLQGHEEQPEAQPLNYVSRVNVPTLMLNGKYDMTFPIETTVRPAFDVLGVSESDKRLVILDTDHYVPKRDLIEHSLDWLDNYLGLVK